MVAHRGTLTLFASLLAYPDLPGAKRAADLRVRAPPHNTPMAPLHPTEARPESGGAGGIRTPDRPESIRDALPTEPLPIFIMRFELEWGHISKADAAVPSMRLRQKDVTFRHAQSGHISSILV